MKTMFKAALVAAALATGSAASAAVVVYTPTSVTPAPATTLTEVDLGVGDLVFLSELVNPGDEFEFRFTALESMRISTVAMAGTGFNDGADLGNFQFGFTPATTSMFTTINNLGLTSSATGSLSGLTLEAGDIFSIFWDDGVGGFTDPVNITATFTTSTIPVPAALPLLAGALALLGAARRKG